MARVTLLIGLTNGQEIDCPINSRDEAQQVIEELRRSDDLVNLPGICFVRTSGSSELGARGGGRRTPAPGGLHPDSGR
jgi:hypothetical protein